MIHVAILLKPYLDAILAGEKTVECRLTRTSRAPFRNIRPGERLYFKQSSGPFRGTAVADRVLFFDSLTPDAIAQLRREYNDRILGRDDYWEWKRDSQFGTLIFLRDVEPIRLGPRISPQRGIAWLCLDESLDVYPQCRLPDPRDESAAGHDFVIPLTAGNLRHGHVYARRALGRFPDDAFGGPTKAQAGSPITLHLSGGPTIRTDIVGTSGIFRSRAWRQWFADMKLVPGDALRFIPVGRREFRVEVAGAPRPNVPTASRST